ncbi:Unannotated [Lentimonas sp. CC4]|nr:Unannotated [Lentimonas sp. CC4]CAA6687025.1 Unannotated [Lentimonas sp. CC6]CAA7075868.1 Unannotated [Lentimonas sp. CC4]CAA7172006.1 Unannotated [Lentimonas sp. CC21]CAA7182931.1 Unannotated [Lentimonas sp. CC8]
MPCDSKTRNQQVASNRRVETEKLKQEAIILLHSRDEEAFLQRVATYCEISCCAWDAIQIDKKTFMEATDDLGREISSRALLGMKKNKECIGEHTGYVKFFDCFEDAPTTLKNYTESITILDGIMRSDPVGGDQ